LQVWHQHDNTDDLFLVLGGRIVNQLPQGDVNAGPGEPFVVPKGIQHRLVAEIRVTRRRDGGT